MLIGLVFGNTPSNLTFPTTIDPDETSAGGAGLAARRMRAAIISPVIVNKCLLRMIFSSFLPRAHVCLRVSKAFKWRPVVNGRSMAPM
jgi:hypothetical protein